MATAQSMILTALQLIGEKPVGGTLTSAEQTEYLSRLNMMLESWSSEQLAAYGMQTDSKVLTAGLGDYTMGAGGDINTTWPTKIDSMYTVDGSGVSRPIGNFVTGAGWSEITLKNLSGGYPNTCWWESDYPLGTIHLWPRPVGGLTLYINSWQRIQSFALISTTASLPPGYELAITTNLAVFLAMGYVEPSPTLQKMARDSKAVIKNTNYEADTLDLPEAVMGGRPYDIYQFPMPV